MGGSITVIRELPYLKSVIEERRDALRDVSKIDAERLDVIIQELNQCSDVLFLGKPSKLYFAVLGGTEKGTFWQWHIKIRIYKINQTTSEIESEKDLSLLGFCHFYHMMAKEMNSLSEDPKSNLQNSSHLSASTFLNEISELSSAPSPVGECCICMEVTLFEPCHDGSTIYGGTCAIETSNVTGGYRVLASRE